MKQGSRIKVRRLWVINPATRVMRDRTKYKRKAKHKKVYDDSSSM